MRFIVVHIGKEKVEVKLVEIVACKTKILPYLCTRSNLQVTFWKAILDDVDLSASRIRVHLVKVTVERFPYATGFALISGFREKPEGIGPALKCVGFIPLLLCYQPTLDSRDIVNVDIRIIVNA